MIIHVPSFSFRLEIIILVGLIGAFIVIYTLRSCCRYSVHEFIDHIMNYIIPIQKQNTEDNKDEDPPMDIVWYTPEPN